MATTWVCDTPDETGTSGQELALPPWRELLPPVLGALLVGALIGAGAGYLARILWPGAADRPWITIFFEALAIGFTQPRPLLVLVRLGAPTLRASRPRIDSYLRDYHARRVNDRLNTD